MGLKADGTVVESQYKGDGERKGAGWEDIVAISAGYTHMVGLKADGTVVAGQNVPLNDYGQCDVSKWHDIIAVSAGDIHTVGLKSDGTVVVVGNNKAGQCAIQDWRLFE